MSTTHAIDSIADLTRMHVRERPTATAFEFEGRRTSWSELHCNSSRLANALIAAGAAPGHRIAYLAKNTDRCFELLCATAKARMVFVPINWRLAGPEIVQILDDCGASILFAGREFIELVDRLRPGMCHVRHYVAIEDLAQPRDGWLLHAAWRDAQSDTDPGGQPGMEEVAIQLYTSGTTGRPKGVMLPTRCFIQTRRSLYAAGQRWMCIRPEDVILAAMPVCHIAGTGLGLYSMYAGAHCIVLREFNAPQALDAIGRSGITRAFMAPAAMQMVLDLPGVHDVDYSRLQYVFYGSSPIPLDLLRRAIGTFGCEFVQSYGLTETFGGISQLAPQHHDPAGSPRMRSAGEPLAEYEVAVVDGAGRRLPPGKVGEIITRSAANMLGYWNQPEATAAALQPDGWLHTGDAGYFDEDGFLYVHDRVKDMIVSGGENVYPAEVESAIYGHPAVADAAVIGVPDPRWGEAVKAIVVLKPGVSATEKEIIDHARTRIAGFKCPKSVDFVAALPRNASGKILKRELRKPFWEGRDRQVN